MADAIRNPLTEKIGAASPTLGRALPCASEATAGTTKEPRDTVAGCRDQAARARREADSAGTANGRSMFERSAASWETRAEEMNDEDNDAVDARAADRALWASEEIDEPGDPHCDWPD